MWVMDSYSIWPIPCSKAANMDRRRSAALFAVVRDEQTSGAHRTQPTCFSTLDDEHTRMSTQSRALPVQSSSVLLCLAASHHGGGNNHVNGGADQRAALGRDTQRYVMVCHARASSRQATTTNAVILCYVAKHTLTHNTHTDKASPPQPKQGHVFAWQL